MLAYSKEDNTELSGADEKNSYVLIRIIGVPEREPVF
jgi:hypothetical protein